MGIMAKIYAYMGHRTDEDTGDNCIHHQVTRCNDDKGASLKYYRSEEGRYKICDNIKEFVRSLPIIDNFGTWLKNFGDAKRRKKKT